MPAVWSQPRTWSVGELVSAALLNSHLRDNLEFLKSPPTGLYTLNQASDYTTTSTSFVNVDNTNLALTLTTAGGDVLIGFYAYVYDSAANKLVYFDVEIDGVRLGGDDGLHGFGTPASGAGSGPVSFVVMKQGLTAGSHTFKVQWKVSGGTATLYAGAGTSTLDIHPQFWVREVS